MVDQVRYHDAVICPRPLPLAEGGFTAELYIRRDEADEITLSRLAPAETFRTRAEAVAFSIAFGKAAIEAGA